jgi:hypothetical protein
MISSQPTMTPPSNIPPPMGVAQPQITEPPQAQPTVNATSSII